MKGPCDEHPITDWGFEPRDYCNWGTVCRLPVGHEGPHAYGSSIEPPNTEALLATVREALTWIKDHHDGVPEANAALDAIASELERQGEEIEGLRYGYRDSQARLDRAVGALREIVALADNASEHYNDLGMADVARASLAEVEEPA